MNGIVKDLTDEKRTYVLIVDGTLFNRPCCKKIEPASRVFDHTDMRYRKGYQLLTLGWSDENTFIPVNNYLLASSSESNIIGSKKSFNKRSIVEHRGKLAQQKSKGTMLELIDMTGTSSMSVDYALFD